MSVTAQGVGDYVSVLPLNIGTFGAQGDVGRAAAPGFLGGGQVGFNWRMAPQWVVGVEADFQGAGQHVSEVARGIPVGAGFNSFDARLNWFGTVRGRIGWNATPSSLLYATGGFAYGQTQVDTAVNIPGPNVAASATARNISTGYAVGGGIETQVAANWSVKAEYLYLDLGNPSAVANTAGDIQAANMNFADHIVRVGLNYKISGDGVAPASSARAAYASASPQVPAWTGVYAGLNAGYGILAGRTFNGIGNAGPPASLVGSSNNIGADGFVGGGQIGYNWQFAPTWVFGIESDFQGASQRGTDQARGMAGGATFNNIEERLNWFGTVRARLGWLATPSTLLYATGGFAYGETQLIDVSNLGPILSTNVTSKGIGTGYAAGGGAETQLAGNWTAKAEYLYLDLGSRALFVPGGGGVSRNTSVAFNDHIVRLGVNYRF